MGIDHLRIDAAVVGKGIIPQRGVLQAVGFQPGNPLHPPPPFPFRFFFFLRLALTPAQAARAKRFAVYLKGSLPRRMTRFAVQKAAGLIQILVLARRQRHISAG